MSPPTMSHPNEPVPVLSTSQDDLVTVTDPASRKGILSVLQQVPLFTGLDARHMSMLADIVEPVKVSKGTRLITEGQIPDIFAVVVQGYLVAMNNGQPSFKLRPYESFGFKNLFDQVRSTYSLVSSDATSCFILQIQKVAFKNLIDREPTFALALLPILAHHVPDVTELAVPRPKSPSLSTFQSSDTSNSLSWPRNMSQVIVKLFDAKSYQNKLFKEQNDLPSFGFQLEFIEEKLTKDTVHLARGAHAVCVFVHDSVDADVAQSLKDMGVQLVAYRCAGFDTCNVATCDKLGLTVTRVPGYSPNAIAEHATALMMSLNRKLIWANARVHTGDFSLDGLVGFDMKGKTVGIIGTGRIGACLVNIMLGFGCQVICHDLYKNPTLLANPAVQYVELEELYAKSDIISLHAPLMPETYHMIDAKCISRMKRGVMLINTSRGPLIDTHALINALKSGQIGSCGLDVIEGENDYFYEDCSEQVVTNDDIAHLLSFQNRVIITSHQAFLTVEALREIALVTLKNIAEFHSGKRLKQLTNSVNSVMPSTQLA